MEEGSRQSSVLKNNLSRASCPFRVWLTTEDRRL